MQILATGRNVTGREPWEHPRGLIIQSDRLCPSDWEFMN